MAATILNSPSLLSSSLLRCMTLLTMRYSFRLSCSRSRAVRFGFSLPERVPKINSYSNFGFAVLYCLVRQATGIQTRLHLRVLFPLLCRRSRWSCWCLGWISPSLFSLCRSVSSPSLSLPLSLPLSLSRGWWQRRFLGGDGSQTGGVTWSKSVGGRLLSWDAEFVRPPRCWPFLTLPSPSSKHCVCFISKLHQRGRIPTVRNLKTHENNWLFYRPIKLTFIKEKEQGTVKYSCQVTVSSLCGDTAN